MKSTSSAPVIISVGGSLIVPDSIDRDFLISFKKLLVEKVKKGERFIIICGGGKTARRYQEAGKEISKLSAADVDWLGIHATRLNAELVKMVLKPFAEEEIVTDPTKKMAFKRQILVAAGWKPGWSTDYVATLLAKRYKARKLINLSNIDYVFDKDPRVFKDAKKIEAITWKQFRNLIPKKWKPGLSSPFDPIASKEAETLSLEVAIINGTKLSEVSNFISHKPFIGTSIKP